MSDIKELALREIREIDPMERYFPYRPDAIELCTRFLAAYLAEQEPRGWWNPSYPSLSVQLTKPHDGGGWEPFFTAPPLAEPAPECAHLRCISDGTISMCEDCGQELPEPAQKLEPALDEWRKGMNETRFRRDIKTAVDRFLGWKLPKDFAPDAGVSFSLPTNHEWWPVGTNLLTAAQAKEMFEYCLKDTGYVVHPEPAPEWLTPERAKHIDALCAAPSSEEVRELVALLRSHLYDDPSAMEDAAADMIERLAGSKP